jgi:hypothetical protein
VFLEIFDRHVHICAVDASFAENFYGLKRRRRPFIETERAQAAVGGVPVEEKLRGREVWRSLVVLVRSFGCIEGNFLCVARSAFLISVPRLRIITRTLAVEQAYPTAVTTQSRRWRKR